MHFTFLWRYRGIRYVPFAKVLLRSIGRGGGRAGGCVYVLSLLGHDEYDGDGDHTPEWESINWSSGLPGSRIDPLGPGKTVTFFPVGAGLALSKSSASERS